MRQLIACLALLFASVLHAETKAIPMKIGAIASLTGDAAKDGQNWMEGAELAIEALKREGVAVDFIVEDDGTSPGRAAAAFAKLARVDGVGAIIGGTWDFLAETAAPLAKEHRVPFITPSNPVELMTRSVKGNPWVFTNGLTLVAEKEVIRRFLAKRAVKSIALLYINVPYGTSHAALIKDLAREASLAVVADDEYSYEGYQNSIRLSALHAAQRKPDLIFAVVNYEGADLLMRELQRVHSSPAVLMTHAFRAAVEFTKDPELYAKAFGVMQSFKSESFTQTFMAKYGREPYGYAAPAYDAVRFLAQLLSRRPTAGNIEGFNLIYEGITGSHRLPSSNGGVVTNKASIFASKNGLIQEVF